jgi:iron complex transport system substrate-binding protein
VDYTAEDVAQRPGWEQITAVQEDNIVTVDADVSSRWGPRLPQFVSVAADALTQPRPSRPADATVDRP